LVAAISIALALAMSEEALIALVNFGALSAFMLLNLTVFVYFFLRQRRYSGVFRFVLFPLIGLLIVGFVWSGFDRTTFLFGGCWLVAGLILGAFKSRRAKAFEAM